MKRKSLMFACATGVLSQLLLMFNIVQVSNYYNSKMDNINLEVVEYKQDTVNTKEYENTYEIENLINSEKGRLIEEKSRIEIDIEVTAYCSCELCCGLATGITASGKFVSKGTIAVPREINLGTNILIPLFANYSRDEKGLFVSEDTGSAIVKKGNVYVIDMWVSSHEEALRIGRVRTKGYILK